MVALKVHQGKTGCSESIAALAERLAALKAFS